MFEGKNDSMKIGTTPKLKQMLGLTYTFILGAGKWLIGQIWTGSCFCMVHKLRMVFTKEQPQPI